MAIGSWFRKEAWAELRTQITHAGMGYLWPWLWAAMIPVSNYMTGAVVPLPYIIVLSGLMFMGVSVGAYFFRKMIFQNNPEGKLRISGNAIGKRYAEKKLVGIKYIFTYQNLATFPIEFEVIPTARKADSTAVWTSASKS